MLLCVQEGVHRCWSVVLKLIIRVAGPGIFSLTSVAQPPTAKAFSAGVWALCAQFRLCGPEVLEISMPPCTPQWKIHNNWWIKALAPWPLVWDTSEVHVLRCLLVSWQLDEAPDPLKMTRGFHCPSEPCRLKPLLCLWAFASFLPALVDLFQFLKHTQPGPLPMLFPLTRLPSTLYRLLIFLSVQKFIFHGRLTFLPRLVSTFIHFLSFNLHSVDLVCNYIHVGIFDCLPIRNVEL